MVKNNQRANKKEGTLEDWKLIKLDALLDNLDFEVDLKDNDEVWEQSYQRFMTYVEENKKLPSDVKNDSEQKIVYSWYISQRHKFNNNELSPERIKKLDLCKLKWNKDKFSLRWDITYKKLLGLNKKHGGIPRYSNDTTEKNLIKWFFYYIKKHKDSPEKLTSKQIEKILSLKILDSTK